MSNTNAIPITEVLQTMLKDVMDFKDLLQHDTSVETVQQILEEMSNYNVDERLPENITTFIAEMVTGGKDYSPESLSGELDLLAYGLNEAIGAQQHQDNVAFVRTILKVLVKHADKVTEWLEKEIQ